MSGPLNNVKVIEFAGIGPGPFCGMLLADMGAEVLRIDRSPKGGSKHIIEGRGKKSVVLNLKDPHHLDICLDLVSKACLLYTSPSPRDRG